MGKGARLKAQRTTDRNRDLVIVDALQVGSLPGALILRVCSPEQPDPYTVAIPAETADGFLRRLYTATIDAEEVFWRLIGPLLDRTPDASRQEKAAAVRAWVAEQGWQEAAACVPDPERHLFMITHAGHVGLGVPEPMAPRDALLVFDPTQLHRVGPGLAREAEKASAAAPGPIARAAIRAAQQTAAGWEWTTSFPTPSPAEADAGMTRLFSAFLRREQFQRPPENNLPPVPGSAAGCERCRVSAVAGGILCVCGHDWTCHPSSAGGAEPCSHCSCQQMVTPEQTGDA